MARVLRNTVITGGVTYARGTAETAELAKRITNPRAWEGEPDPAPRKRTSPRTAPAKPAASPEASAPETQESEAPVESTAPEATETATTADEDPAVVVTSDGAEHVGLLPASAATDPETPEATSTEQPPRGGAGSGAEAWRAYATGLGIEVPEDAGRDDIVALVDARDGSDQ